MNHEVQSSVSGKKKEETRATLIAHKIRAKKFYKTLKETPQNFDTLCFDLQQVILNSRNNITKSVEYLAVQPWLGTGLLTSTNEKWHARRKMLTPTFHFKILEEYISVFNSNSRILVDKLESLAREPYVEISSYIAMCTLDIICALPPATNDHIPRGRNLVAARSRFYIGANPKYGKETDVMMKEEKRIIILGKTDDENEFEDNEPEDKAQTKNDAETDQEEEKELAGSLVEKKLPSEGCIGRNGEGEKSSGHKKISMIDDMDHMRRLRGRQKIGRLENAKFAVKDLPLDKTL
ncbi:hypothetical protein ANN_01557 [Periplaneta americana]|uniref:Cytochrome P450 n=1 Tax=Periplaneta americana TaxID=6978 RepID=A0ABQ8TY02_PERAM|nr:hypothetical protein ANN_01557 [Periplaneta americana]